MQGIDRPAIKKAQQQLDALSGDELTRYQAFVRERALHDEVTEKAEARAEGEAVGRIEGQANILRRQLQAKFGPLSATIEQRLQAAGETELTTWAERVLFAERLEQVFAD